MPVIHINDFKGTLPRRHKRLLPDGYAQIAANARLTDGALEPFRAPEVEHVFPENVNTVYRHQNEWLGWEGIVHAAPGPVAQDRLYITGDGVPKMRVDGEVYDLALHPPELGPAAEISTFPDEPVPNNPDDPITGPIPPPWVPPTGSGDQGDPGDPQPGEPFELVVIRQPEGGVSGKTLITQPALAVVDVDGNLCADDDWTRATVAIKSGIGGLITGWTKTRAQGGIIRFRNLALRGSEDEVYVMRFSSPNRDIRATESEDITVTADPSLLAESVTYAYTFVTQFGEESALSPFSQILDWWPGCIVTVEHFSPPQANRGIETIRIYRSQTSAGGVTDLYFVADIPVAEGVYEHDMAETPLGEVLPSADYDPPPDTLRGLISMANGMMAAFDGKSVRFCEPFRPHAWPTKYELTTDYDIVGLAAFGTNLAILTTGTPYIAQGYSPQNMAMEKIEQNLPCISARSIVDLGYSVAFASYDGLVVIGTGGTNVITKEIFSRDQWRTMRPFTIVAEQFGGRYVFSYYPDNATSRRMGVVDLTTGQQPFFMEATDVAPEAFYHRLETGELCFLEDGVSLFKWDSPEGESITYHWKSKLYSQPALLNFGAFYVESDESGDSAGTTFTAAVYADGNKIHETSVINAPIRLPGGFLASDWEVEVSANIPITAIWLAGSIDELSGVS